MNIHPKNKAKIFLFAAEMLCLFIVFLFSSPFRKAIDTYSLRLDAAASKSDSQTAAYEQEYVWEIASDVPAGSYELQLSLDNVQEQDFLYLSGTTSLTSPESMDVSCSLSPYGEQYTFSFSCFSDNNSLYLRYCDFQAEAMPAIQSIHLTSTPILAIQRTCLLALAFIIIDLILLLWKKLGKRKWGVLIATASLASIPLFCLCVFYGHDTLFHLTRIEGLKAGLLSGQFPVRISAVQYNGYGYASSAMYPEFFLYFPALLRLLGLSVSISYCIFWFVINILTAYIAWSSFYGISKSKTAALIGCLLFTLLPYRLISIYVRGAFGEALALTFFPLILWGIYEIFYGNTRRWPIALIGYTGVMQSHVLTTESVIILSILAGLVHLPKLWKERSRLLSCILLVFSFILVNLWFLIPFLMLYRLPLWVKYMRSDFLDHALFPSQLFSIFFRGYGNSYPVSAGTSQEMSFGIGLGLLLGTVFLLYAFAKHLFHSRQKKGLCLSFFLIALFLYWTTTTLFPWEAIQTLFPQFSSFTSNLPWRKLGIAGLFLTAAVCIAAAQADTKDIRRIIVPIALGTFISAGSFMISFLQSNNPYIVGNSSYEDTADELYLYYGTDLNALNTRGNIIEKSDTAILLYGYQKQFTNIHLCYENPLDTEQWIEVPLNYYPGYVAQDADGKDYLLADGQNHIARLILPASSSGEVFISYENCTTYRLATVISIVYAGLFLLAFVIYKTRTKRGAHL